MRRVRLVGLAFVVLAASASAALPASAATRSCPSLRSEALGDAVRVRASAVTCATARTVIRSYQRAAAASTDGPCGVAEECVVLRRWTCTRRDADAGFGEEDLSCRRGERRVRWRQQLS